MIRPVRATTKRLAPRLANDQSARLYHVGKRYFRTPTLGVVCPHHARPAEGLLFNTEPIALANLVHPREGADFGTPAETGNSDALQELSKRLKITDRFEQRSVPLQGTEVGTRSINGRSRSRSATTPKSITYSAADTTRAISSDETQNSRSLRMSG